MLKNFTRKEFALFSVFGALSNLLWVTLFIYAASMTLISHAELFSGLCCCFIVLQKLLMRYHITKIEVLATIVAIIGGVIMTLDGDAKKANSVA